MITDGLHELAIEGIEFSLVQGQQSVGFVADAGVGKTTIFRSLFSKYVEIWSLEHAFRFSCEHTYNGKKFTHLDIKENNVPVGIGFASQYPYFFDEHTVFDNIFAPLRWKGMRMADNERNKFIALLDLSEISTRTMSNTSGGQRQLVNIARMMVTNPQIAIIDECFSSMNEEMACFYIDKLKDVFKNTLFIVTSHRRSDIEHFGSKIVRLKKNKHRSGRLYVTQE